MDKKMNRLLQPKTSLTVLALCVSGALLAGCAASDDEDSGSSNITGTAAVGAPIAGATVTLMCQNLDDEPVTTTNSSGKFTFSDVDGDRGACALEIGATATTPALHTLLVPSLSGDTITANITPLTELVFAKALYNAGLSNTTVSDWLNLDHSETEINLVVNAVPGAVSSVVAALNNANTGTDLPAGFNPITTSFTAGSLTDQYDQFLDAIREALGTTTYEDFFASIDLSSSTLGVPTINVVIDPNLGGTGTLTIVTTAAGITTQTTTVDNVIVPANQSEFCGAEEVVQAYTAAGFTSYSCSFSGNVGTISGTVNSGGFPVNLSMTFTFS